jgi:putative ABC transport system permease protein
MNFLRQFLAILRVNLSEVTQRTGPLLTIIIGVTCAVGVLVSMLAMGTGARKQEMGNVRPDRVILSSTGARFQQSTISRDEAAAILSLPGIRKSAAGDPIVVFNSALPIQGRRRGSDVRIYFPLIGASSNLTQLWTQIHFTAGRIFHRGLHELIASNACVRQFTGFELGEARDLHGTDWKIVGLFDNGAAQQCMVLADVDSIMTAFSRNTYSSMSALLESPAAFGQLRDAVAANPVLHLDARLESEVMEETFKPLNAILNFISYFVGAIMALGATLGAVNSLYAIVDGRRRELATLRAIGFGSAAIISATLCESILLAVPGALLGSALAWILFNGLAASPFSFSIQLIVTPSLVVLGITWALAMGFLGGLFPAIRAARVPVTTALRAT